MVLKRVKEGFYLKRNTWNVAPQISFAKVLKINFLGLIFPRMPTDTYYFWEGKKHFAQEMTDLDEETSKATHILPYL